MPHRHVRCWSLAISCSSGINPAVNRAPPCILAKRMLLYAAAPTTLRIRAEHQQDSYGSASPEPGGLTGPTKRPKKTSGLIVQPVLNQSCVIQPRDRQRREVEEVHLAVVVEIANRSCVAAGMILSRLTGVAVHIDLHLVGTLV